MMSDSKAGVIAVVHLLPELSSVETLPSIRCIVCDRQISAITAHNEDKW